MNRMYILFVSVCFLFLSSCKKEEQIRPANSFMMNEDSQKGQMAINLNWSINGVPDNGMIADISIYLTEGDYEDINKLEYSTISGMDYYGKQKITPSKNSLADLYRYYIGIGYNGLLTADPSITFPLTIDYTLELKFSNETSATKTITGTLIIQSNEKDMTKIVYPYSMDINDSKVTDEHRSYSLKQIDKPLLVLRECDVLKTNIMETKRNFTIEARWKTAHDILGYNKIDLNLFLHDTTTIPLTYDALDAASYEPDSYEKISISSSNTLFDNGNPKFLGFAYNENLGLATPDEVKIMFKITSYGTDKIHRYVVYFTFNPAAITPKSGRMYLVAKVVKGTDGYTISNLPSVITFKK